jgi:hypothetical protein
MNVTMSNYNVLIADSERDVLKCLLSGIKTSKETQVLVTGPSARNLYWKDTKEFEAMLKQAFESDISEKKCSYCGTIVLKKDADCPNCGREVFDSFIAGSDWNYFGPPYNPSRSAIIESLDSFANTIKHEPRTPHIYIGPTYEKEVVKRLFFPSPSQSYRCGIYVLGIYDEPLTHLNTISRAAGGMPHMTGSITSIFSTSDKSVSDQFKRRLAIAHERKEDNRELSLLYFKYLENIKWLEPEYRKSVDRKFTRNIKKTLKKEIIPKLYPKKLFPEMKVRSWWRFW